MKLTVISPCSAPDDSMAKWMVASARRVGIEPILYSIGKGMHPHCDDIQGTLWFEMLEKHKEWEIVCAVDAFDVAFLAGAKEMIEKFQTFKTGLVVSAEAEGVRGIEKTQEELHRQCIAAGDLFPQMNIGCWIGEREYTLHVFKEAERLQKGKPENPDYAYDNLYQWMAQMKAQGGGAEFDLDRNCVVFQSMNKADLSMMYDRVYNNVTHTIPCVLHYNGDKTYMAYRRMVESLLEG